MTLRPTVFGLVPGAGHGAWCWQRVIGALDVLGYRGVAMDLPCEDDTAGANRYADVVVKSLSGVHDEIVLVGHSLGGLTIPLVAQRRPVSKLVFLAGVLPMIGMSFDEQKRAEPEIVLPHPGGPRAARERFYSGASEADAAWAESQMHPQSQTPYLEVTPLTQWPDTDVAVVVPTEDRTVNPNWQRKAAVERLGVQPVEVTGADHSPFLTQPAELARVLVALAEGS